MENKVVKAILKDCSTLIEKFVNENNLEFRSFCNIYKKLQFHHIYSIQLSDTDMILTTRYVFFYCKNLFNPNKISSAIEKVGAIYLLYCTYHKQPQKHYVKIQVDINKYKTMREFVDILEEKQYQQVRYIFYHLLNVNAFRFVYNEIYYGLEPHFNRVLDYTDINVSNNSETENFFNPEMSNLKDSETGFFKAFNILEKEYNSKKRVLNDREKIDSKKIPFSNIIEEYKTKLDDIATLLNSSNNDKILQKNLDSDSSKVSLKSYIKIKAFAKNVQLSRNYTSTDSENEVNDVTTNIDIDHRKRKNRTAVNNFLNEPLPEDLSKELELDD